MFINNIKKPAERIDCIIFHVFGGLLGFVAFFLTVYLLSSWQGLLSSLIISIFGGLMGLFVALTFFQKGRVVTIYAAMLLLAYMARVVVGLIVYMRLDPSYFEGTGDYKWGHSELELSFYATRIVFDYLSGSDGGIGDEITEVLNSGISKNPMIHWWMGFYLKATGIDYALNLMSFNAVHSCFAGIGITALARYYGYSYDAASKAGVLVAWLPWGFPASLLWRDTIGMYFVVLAINIMVLALWRYKLNALLIVPALILLFAHRTVYPVVGVLFLMWEYIEKLKYEIANKWILLGLASLLLPVMIYFSQDIILMYYTSGDSFLEFGRKLITFPLLVIRSMFGTFPWWQFMPEYVFMEKIWDYMYNILQLAIFISIVKNIKHFISKFDGMHVVFVTLYFLALVAPGLHTSYLAMSIPFILPYVFSVSNEIAKYVVWSLVAFVMANLLYYLLGLEGGGYIMDITGY